MLLSVAPIVVRRENWGLWETGALLLAAAMMVLFAVDAVAGARISAKTAGAAALRRIRDAATLLLLFGALIVLGVVLLHGLATLSIGKSLVAGVFFVVFAGILRDYIRRMRRNR